MKLRKRWPAKTTLGYIAVLLACFASALMVGWTALALRVDSYAYDWMIRFNPPAPAAPSAAVLTIDDATLNAMGGMRRIRGILAEALERVAAARPRVVAVDIILFDAGDPNEDARLDRAFADTRNLVLVTDLIGRVWEDPLPQFQRSAKAVGHAEADEDSPDGVFRQIPLEKSAGHERHWAMALEAFRIARGGAAIVESIDDIQIGSTVIKRRPLRIRYSQTPIPQVSLKELIEKPSLLAQLRDKVVFIGVFSPSAARDRVVTPYGDHIYGVTVNAEAFETLQRGQFLVNASDHNVLLLCATFVALAGLIFALLAGWPAYLSGAVLLAIAHATPFALFEFGVVFPFAAPLASAWFAMAGAASYQHFIVRRQLRNSETERTRYQQAIHFVTHEMRTPLTAIQGSSEMMSRYNLSDEKSKQIAQMINAESKRLARMIQTFLDVERLSDGQIELKREPFDARGLIEACVGRARPLAERKSIGITVEEPLTGALQGDRELMEYAVYNLLTNAIKYSPHDTAISVRSRSEDGHLRLSIEDQGFGMDARELRKIFQKFYRTRRAEASGEQGSGIGLSIVEQIVRAHGGRMEVTSKPNQGSCFTIVLPAEARDRKAPAVSTL